MLLTWCIRYIAAKYAVFQTHHPLPETSLYQRCYVAAQAILLRHCGRNLFANRHFLAVRRKRTLVTENCLFQKEFTFKILLTCTLCCLEIAWSSLRPAKPAKRCLEICLMLRRQNTRMSPPPQPWITRNCLNGLFLLRSQVTKQIAQRWAPWPLCSSHAEHLATISSCFRALFIESCGLRIRVLARRGLALVIKSSRPSDEVQRV